MKIYRHFAQVYDNFMANTPYGKWAGYITEILRKQDIFPGSLVLDLACGTGTLSLLMAQKGYDMIAADASPDMLSIAQSKAFEASDGTANILFLMQDMRKLELYGTVNAAYCACDGLNYMLTENDMLTVLKKTALFLNPAGLFLFDLNTDYKFDIQLGQQTFTDDIKNASYIWKNHYNPQTCINEYRVRFFMQDENGENINFSETHYQRAYSIETITALARQAGLRILAVYDDYTFSPPRAESERITYIAQKLVK